MNKDVKPDDEFWAFECRECGGKQWTLWTPEKEAIFLLSLRGGNTVAFAANLTGAARQTVYTSGAIVQNNVKNNVKSPIAHLAS